MLIASRSGEWEVVNNVGNPWVFLVIPVPARWVRVYSWVSFFVPRVYPYPWVCSINNKIKINLYYKYKKYKAGGGWYRGREGGRERRGRHMEVGVGTRVRHRLFFLCVFVPSQLWSTCWCFCFKTSPGSFKMVKNW